MDSFYGTWKVQLDKTEGVAEVGKLFGWTEEKQQAMSSLDYTLLIELAGGKNRCYLDYGAVNMEFFFTLGEPFDYTGVDGTTAKCTVLLEGGRLLEHYVSDAGPKWTTERILDGTTMTANTTFDGMGVKCTQVLVKV